MNDIRSTVGEPLPPSVLQRLDAICERFEDAWQAGQRPRIDDYLSEAEEAERDRLLRELIALDIDYRRQLGEKPEPHDYRGWSPLLDERWLERLTGANRYELVGQIGRGGMGTVLQGYDRHLRRDLAVKMLRPEHRDQPHMVRRFLREAWIGARLQHPGILPVYDLGEFADRQPFFTMKLVRGRTLEALLKKRENLAEELPRFLTIFEQVCQTVAYAHAQGVIHRDLKPSNIMVGAFGEVQVMDWGLAKVLNWAWQGGTALVVGRDPDAAQRTMEATDPGFQTQAGQAMGTIAYMPPEQARGEVDRLDERSDVFGLGAILCEILIGTPPFRGASATEVLDRAKVCDHREAMTRLDGCGADAALLRLTKACLAAEPHDRPSNAAVVAAAVKAYQTEVQERLQTAERERAAAQARAKEERKTAAAERRARRRTAWLAMAVLLLGLVGGGAALWWTWRQAELVRLGKEDLAEFTEDLRGWKIREAQKVMERAEGRAASGGPAELLRQVVQMRADLTLVERLEKIRLSAATWTEQKFDYATADRDYATVFQERGLAAEGEDPKVVADRIQGSAIKTQLVAALDDWAIATALPARRAWLLEVARRAEPGEWSDRFRDPAVWEKRADLEQLAKDANVAELSPQLLTALSLALVRQQANAVPLLTAAQERHPADFWLNFQLGHAVHRSNPDEAIGYYRAALASRPKTSAVYNNLGNVLRNKGRLNEAVKEYHKAIELDPKLVLAHYNLGLTLYRKHDLDGAIPCYKTAIALDSRFAPAHYDLGVALKDKRDLDGAIACYKTVIRLNPKNSMAHNNLGLILDEMGQRDEAIEEYHKAIESDPKLAMAHYNLGNSLRGKEQFDKALGEYKEAIRLKNDFAEAHCNLSQVLQRKGRFAEALEYLRRGHELGSQQTSWRYPSAQWLRQCERLMELDHKLPAILRGEAEPADVSERLALADLCGRYKRLPAASARLYADAFTTEPNLATGLNQQYRYNAACSAALAAAGQGEDARPLPDKVAAMFRHWALSWLREELAAYDKIAPQSNAAMKQTVQQRLAHWQRDPDLAGVRAPEQLAKLPPAEQEGWRRLWAGVASLAALADRVGRLADDAKVPSPVTTLRTTAVKRNTNQAIRAAALHLPYAYVLDRTGDLWVFKLPDEAGEKPGQELQEVEHLSSAGDGNALVVIGDNLLCSRAGSVEVFSLEDPARPRHLGKFGPEKRYWSQALVRSHDRLILVGPGGLSVFDISNPARPQHLSTIPPQRFSWNGCVMDGRLYVAEVRIPSFKNSRDGIAIYDLADPTALKEVGFVETPAGPYHLLPVGKDRLAVLMDNRTQLFSIADPLKPAALGQPVAASARSGAVLPIDGRTYLVTSHDVFRIEEKSLVRIGGFRAGGTYDGQPYHGSSQGGYAIIPLSEAAVVLRPENGSAARLLSPGRPGPEVLPTSPVQVGQKLDLAGPTVEGDKFDLKQLRGKVVLIDFWATWCGPCVAEMPNVKRVYDRYHKDGFEVVGVSLDNSKEKLVQFLKAKEVSWPQLFFEEKGDQGWNNPLARK